MLRSALSRNLLQRAAVLAGLVLAVAALGSPSALAKRGGSDRPIKGKQSGTTVFDLATGSFVTDATGVVSHLGRASSRLEGVLTLTGPTSFTISGSVVTVAANGDSLLGTFTGTGTLDAAGNAQGETVTTFTGGTGRFEDASGTVTGPFSQVATSTVGTTSTFATSFSLRGTITY